MAWWEVGDRGTCGRPIKKSGLPCLRSNDEYLPEACYSHLTREERVERNRLAATARAEREARYAALEPNCWLWTVPTDMELREQFLERFAQDPGGVRPLLAGYLEDRESLAWFAFKNWHNERCALCGVRPSPLVRDHDHRTGLIRGYLCQSCNIAEGMHRGEAEGPYAKYRARNPATMMGLSMTYTDGWGYEVRDPSPRAVSWGEDNPLYGIGL